MNTAFNLESCLVNRNSAGSKLLSIVTIADLILDGAQSAPLYKILLDTWHFTKMKKSFFFFFLNYGKFCANWTLPKYCFQMPCIYLFINKAPLKSKWQHQYDSFVSTLSWHPNYKNTKVLLKKYAIHIRAHTHTFSSSQT